MKDILYKQTVPFIRIFFYHLVIIFLEKITLLSFLFFFFSLSLFAFSSCLYFATEPSDYLCCHGKDCNAINSEKFLCSFFPPILFLNNHQHRLAAFIRVFWHQRRIVKYSFLEKIQQKHSTCFTERNQPTQAKVNASQLVDS